MPTTRSCPMSDFAWKAYERRLAHRLGGRRIPCTGEKDGVDVDAGPFCYQAKLRGAVSLATCALGFPGSWKQVLARAPSEL